MPAASMPLTKQLTVAIIDSNLALGRKDYFKKDDPPDPRVSAITPATISFFKGIRCYLVIIVHYVFLPSKSYVLSSLNSALIIYMHQAIANPKSQEAKNI
ncbi:hypothetical protein CsSME_00031822 [Camellia sinensis var. sinensis]